jgi:hypothetical protein
MRIITTILAILFAATTCAVGAPKKPIAKPHAPKQPLAVEYVPKPIPAGPKASTQKQFDELLAKFYHREIVEEYKRVGNRDPEWDSEAITFLEHFAAAKSQSDDEERSKKYSSCQSEGRRLVQNTGCTDPMVMSCYALSRPERNAAADIETRHRILNVFAQSKYHCYQPRAFAQQFMEFASGTFLYEADTDLLLDSLCDGTYRAGEQRIALENIPTRQNNTEGGCIVREGQVQYILDGLAKRKGIDPYVRDVVAARCHMMKAWISRGGGFASEVTGTGWNGFRKEMSEARKLLMAAYALHPEYPEAACDLVEVIGTGGAEKGHNMRVWFDRAVAAQLDYLHAYSSYLEYNLPRWGGELSQLYRFAVECVNTKRFDTGVPFMYFQAMRNYITNNMDGDARYWRKPETAKYLDTMFDGYAKANYGKGKDWYQSLHAAYCADCCRYSDARRILLELGDHADPKPFSEYYRLDYTDTRNRVMMLGGPLGPEFCKAEELWGQAKYKEARAVYQQVEKRTTDDATVRSFLDRSIERLDLCSTLAEGAWAILKPPSNFNGWKVDGGNWSTTGDGTIDGSPKNGFQLRYPAKLQDKYEVAVDIQFLGEQKPGVGAGIIISSVEPELVGDTYVYCSMADKKVAVMDAFERELWSAKGVDVGEINTLLAQVWGDRISVYLNGHMLKQRISAQLHSSDPRSCVGIGYRYPQCGPYVKFSNLRIRLLTADPSTK